MNGTPCSSIHGSRGGLAAPPPRTPSATMPAMKLATYQDGSRDGQLVVVSRDLATAHYATGVTSRLQQVLDDWSFLSPQLQDISDALNQDRARHSFAFDPQQCMAPLPRAVHWVCAAAYGNQPGDLQPRQQLGLNYGPSDYFLGPCGDAVMPSEAMGIDFGASLAVVTGDLAMGAVPEQALDSIRLILLANVFTLRHAPQHAAVTAFAPVAVTPDELALHGSGGNGGGKGGSGSNVDNIGKNAGSTSSAWLGGRLHLAVQSTWNGRRVGMCDSGPDMTFHFGELLAHLASTRNLRAGCIVGSGPVRNPPVHKNGRAEWPMGYSCIADKRAMETAQDGQPTTDFMRYGDTIRIELKGKNGQSVFGAIDQSVLAPASAQNHQRDKG